METYKLPTRAELDKLLVKLLPPAVEMETASAEELRAELEERRRGLASQGVDIPPDLLDMIVTIWTTKEDPADPHYIPLPTHAQLEKLIERLLPPDEEIDEVSAAIILEREGVDRSSLADDLRQRLERRVEELRGQGKDVSPRLLDVLSILESSTPS